MSPRHYSDEFKARAIEKVEASNCNFRRASTQTGVSIGTLRRWWLEYQEEITQAKAEADSLSELRKELIENALRLARELKDANGSVTFTQCAAALNQLVDKVIRLMDKLPEEEVEEIIRIAYEDEDFKEEDETVDREGSPPGRITSQAEADSAE